MGFDLYFVVGVLILGDIWLIFGGVRLEHVNLWLVLYGLWLMLYILE